MLKPVVVAAAAIAIAGSSIVYAQQRSDGPGGDGGPRSRQHYQPSAQDMAAFTDARVAALRAGLQLTPDQAKNWPPFEQALRDMAKLRAERMLARQAGSQPDQAPATPFERLARRADSMSKTGAALKQIADTGMPLYQSLDDAQKRRFRILALMLRPHHHHMHASNEGYGPRWRQGYEGGDGYQGGQWRRFENRRFGQGNYAPTPQLQNLMDSEDQGSQL